MTNNKPAYAVFCGDLIVSPPFDTQYQAMKWALQHGFAKAISMNQWCCDKDHDIKEIPTVDIDAIYRKQNAAPNYLAKKAVHGLLMVLVLTQALTACTTLSPKMQLAEAVSQKVNRSMTYQSDADQYGQSDRWVVYPTSKKGDCEDYALTKMWELKEAKIPSVMHICALDSGVWHAVNVVWDDGKRWVLDNTRPYATEFSQYPCKIWFAADLTKRPIYVGK